jgi:hypothetical protein
VARNKIKEVEFRNFSGGLNSRDWASELSGNEFPDSLNVTVDERGGAQKRLGYEDRYGTQVGTGLVGNLFHWPTQNKIVAQVGTGMHLDGAASFHTWTTSARVGMCEFLGNLMMIHPVDGLKVYNGAAVSTPTNPPVGNTCAAWQNKLWCGGDPSNPPRLYYSDIGSADRTAGTQYIDVREKDSALLTCIGGAAGMDIGGRPGLLVCKQDSTYRVHDSAAGSYTTIDPSQGAGSNISMVSVYGRTYVINTRGIYSTNGLDPLREDSQLIENLFNKNQINQSRPDLLAAGRFQDRLYFSYPRAGETANTRVIELHPIQQWVVPHTNAASAYASVVRGTTDLVFGSPSTQGRIYNSHVGGSDNGAAIASSLTTRWLEPSGGYLSRLRRARFTGIGDVNVALLKDYQVSNSGVSLNVTMDAGVADPTYDDGFLYDDDNLYAAEAFQNHDDHFSLGTCRALALKITESSTTVKAGRPIFGGTALPQQGAWSLAHVRFLAVDLGIN